MINCVWSGPHLRGLRDTFPFPRTLGVTEAAAGLHTAAGLHRQVEAQGDLRGCGGAHTHHTCHSRGEGRVEKWNR